jgi:hypothetical protein
MLMNMRDYPTLHLRYKIKVKEQLVVRKDMDVNKGNNKITELRTILQRESQNS